MGNEIKSLSFILEQDFIFKKKISYSIFQLFGGLTIYAVKAQTSLAPLSWFPGSRKPTAHVHQCCRFSEYEIYKRNLQSVNHIPGIHDNGPHGPRCDVWL